MFDPDHDSYDSSGHSLGENRFPDGAWGVNVWRSLVDQIHGAPSSQPATLDHHNPIDELQRPRIFVSHQQKDAPLANRIAWLASRSGFSYWLDVLDPDLKRLHGRKLDPTEKALLIAKIVETALLNCTHVVAILTQASKSLNLPRFGGHLG